MLSEVVAEAIGADIISFRVFHFFSRILISDSYSAISLFAQSMISWVLCWIVSANSWTDDISFFMIRAL